LIQKAEEDASQFEFESAADFYRKALDLSPENTEIMDDFGDVLLELGQTEEAKKIFTRSIELAPEENFSKYMNLSQISTGAEAIRCP